MYYIYITLIILLCPVMKFFLGGGVEGVCIGTTSQGFVQRVSPEQLSLLQPSAE